MPTRMYHPNILRVVTVADTDVPKMTLWGYKTLAAGQNPPALPGAQPSLTVGQIVTDPALRAAFAPRRTRTVLAVGDSLTEGSGAGGGGLTTDVAVFPTRAHGALQYQGGSWVTWALLASQARWTIGGVFATGGYTAAQILATHVPAAIAAAKPGDTVVVLAGTNGNVFTDVQAIHEALRNAGLHTVAVTIPPSTSSTLSNVAAFNARLKAYAAAKAIPLVDVHGALVDPATGAYLTAYNGDGVHPNQLGAQLMGQTIATVLNGFHATPVPLVEHNAAITGQLQSNPLAQAALTSGTDFGTLSGLGTSTIAQASDADFRGGKCYLFTRGDTDINGRLKTATLVPGNRMRVGMALKAAAGTSWGMRWESNTTGQKVLLGVGYPTSFSVPQGIARFYVEFTVPTLPDYVYRSPRLYVGGAGAALSLGEITVQDLTAMGVV